MNIRNIQVLAKVWLTSLKEYAILVLNRGSIASVIGSYAEVGSMDFGIYIAVIKDTLVTVSNLY